MSKRQSIRRLFCLVLLLLFVAISARPPTAFAYSANKVWIETLDDGRYRVGIVYTVPALKEFRQAHAIFNKKKEADTFYWQLVQGAEFSVNGPAGVRFLPPKYAPTPW